MHEFSTVDGFVEISECMAEMTKYVANEPSAGLFFIQQHAQNAVPNIIKVRKNLVEKVHETTLHTEDLRDSITMVQSMKECGFHIADEMIGDIKKSLTTLTTKQPKKGLIHPSTSRSNSRTERATFWGNHAFYAKEIDYNKKSNYFSSVLNSAKQKVNNLKWQQQLDGKRSVDSREETPQLSVKSVTVTSSLPGNAPEELPISSQIEDESQIEQIDVSEISIKLLSVSEKYDEFKANKEAKLEGWLEGTSNIDDYCTTAYEKSSTTAAGAVDSIPSALELNNADAKSNIVSGFSARASEQASSAAASTSLLTPPTSVSTFGNGSNKNNGTAVSSPAFSSPFPPVVTNTLTSQSIFGGPSLASTSSISATATSTSTGMTSSTPAVIASSNSSSSAPVAASSSATNSTFKFGSTLSPSTSLLVSSGSEPVETKIGQFAGFGNTGSTPFGSSSAAVGSTGSGIFGFSAPATTSVSSQSQGSFFGTTSGSTPSSGFATSNQSQSVAFGSTPSSSFATSNQSQSVAFGSSASPVSGLTGNAAFSSGSSLFPSSSPATNTFNSGTTSGQSTATPSLEANPVSSNNGTSSTSFGISSWPPSKSPFGTNFSSTPSTSGFPLGSSTPSASTSSSMIFGSSTSASGPQFSFTSAAATPNMQPASTNTQPAFGSSAPGFAFGSTSVNNDQMSMEDSMAEDTVQATPPATPVFGQQPAPVQSNFGFGAPTPTPANPFQFGGQQNIAPQNPSPFQASGSLEFNAGGSFSLGNGGNYKSSRRIVKVKHKLRKK